MEKKGAETVFLQTTLHPRNGSITNAHPHPLRAFALAFLILCIWVRYITRALFALRRVSVKTRTLIRYP